MADLTDAEKAMLARVRDDWLAVAYTTGPADRPEAERGVREAYLAAGLAPPSRLLWFDSPFEGAVAAWLLNVVNDTRWDAVEVELWKSDAAEQALPDEHADHVRVHVRNAVWDLAEYHVHSPIALEVCGSAGFRSLPPPLVDRIWAEICAQSDPDVFLYPIRPDLWYGCWADYLTPGGQHIDAGYLAAHDAHSRLGAGGWGRFAGLARVARNAGWWWALRDAAILTERPVHLDLDERGRLHNAGGPAATYPDGFAVHAVDGDSP